MAEQRQQLHAIVHGLVQGVYFRYHTSQVANDLGVVGWVRNLPDGTVEVTAVGTTGQLEKLLSFLRKGPPAAQVTGVETEWSSPTEKFKRFDVRRY